MSNYYYTENQIKKGECLETVFHNYLSDSLNNVEIHFTNREGPDAKVYDSHGKIRIIVECLNWKEDSYVNSARFSKIVISLLSFPNVERIFAIAGASLSDLQNEICRQYGIKVCYLPNDEHKKQWKGYIDRGLRLGCIYLSTVIDSIPRLNTLSSVSKSLGMRTYLVITDPKASAALVTGTYQRKTKDTLQGASESSNTITNSGVKQ